MGQCDAGSENRRERAGGSATDDRMRDLLERQRASYQGDGFPAAEIRIDRLERAIAMVDGHRQEIVDALCSDFGHRSAHLSELADVGSPIHTLVHAKRNVRKWMRSERPSVELLFKLMGYKARIDYEPLGVVGIIGPWNYPMTLIMDPLAEVLAAGNRAMLKPSELTPSVAELLARMVAGAFDETEVAVVTGGPEVGAAFSALQFDHLMFTGSTRVGRLVMKAAADNLVPVTLELGGKSPTFVSRSFDLSLAARRIMTGKIQNSGQLCMSPDHAFVPAEQRERFVEAAREHVARMFPTIVDNPDYTSIINEHHYRRLQGYLEDASARGASIVELNPASESFANQTARKIPPTLILDPTDDMLVMQEEIFGPLLPVMTYQHLDEAIEYVRCHPKPLALYYFGTDADEREHLLSRTSSGGVTINETAMQFLAPELPFGGVGASGIGKYRGIHGFRNFSNARGIAALPCLAPPSPMEPPYGRAVKLLTRVVGRIS